MNQAAILMDPMDPRIQLDVLQNTERRTLDTVKGLNFVNKKKEIVQAKGLAWLINHGHIPRLEDHTLKGKALRLHNWVPGDLYMQTSDWRNLELDGYAADHYYCSLRGEDLEYDSFAYEATHGILSIPRKSLDKLINMIYDEFAKVYDMEKFPRTDKGPFGQLLRCQMVCVATQSARDSITKVLDHVVVSIPSTMEKLRDIETIMRDFVALDERARFLTQGSREDHWAQEFIKNNFKAGAAQLFPNQATFGNVLDEMRALAKERTRGHQLTLSVLWGKYTDAYMMVNGSSGEGIHNVMRVLSEPGTARVMLAQAARAPFADRNGREKTVSGGKGTDGDEPETMADLRRIVAEQANTITQLRKTQDPGKFQRRTAYKGQRKGQDEQHQSTQDTRPLRKRVLVPEGQAQQSSIHPTIPGKAQANMLHTSRATSDSDEEPDRSRAHCPVRIMQPE